MKIHVLTALLASALLTACGGGGGGSVTPPTGGGGTQSNAKLNAGFAQTGKTSQSRNHIALAIRRQGATLNGGIYPIANFWIPDSYVAPGTYPSIGESEVAYVTGGPVPTPAPVVTFQNISGPVLSVIATPSPVPAPAGLPSGATIIGGQIVGAGTSVGQSLIVVSAMNQTAQITANTYMGLDLDTGGIYNTGAAGLTFTATGAQPTASGATPDLSIDTSQSVSALTAPGGIVEVQKPIDQVTASDFVQSQAVTTLRDVNLCNLDGVVRSFVFSTPAGLLVKFQPIALSGSNVAAGVCSYNDIRGPYGVSGQNGFSY